MNGLTEDKPYGDGQKNADSEELPLAIQAYRTFRTLRDRVSIAK